MRRYKVVRLPDESLRLVIGEGGRKMIVNSGRTLYRGEWTAVLELVNHTIMRKGEPMTMREVVRAVSAMHDCLEGIISEQGYDSIRHVSRNPLEMMVNGSRALSELRKMSRTEKKGGAR